MPNLKPVPSWPDVYQIEKTDRVLGGAGGIANQQAQQLLNRTEALKIKSDGAVYVAETPEDISEAGASFGVVPGRGVFELGGGGWSRVISNDSANPFSHSIDIQCKFPWAFKDYEDQLASLGLNDKTGYIMAGGFTIVEDDNSFWTIAGMSSVSYLRKYDLDTGDELGFYKLNTSTIAEGLVVSNYYGVWTAFVGGRQDGFIDEFIIEGVPFGSTLDISKRNFVDLYNQFAFRNGTWICESKTPEVSNYTLRNILTVFNDKFEPTGQIKLPVWSSGNITVGTSPFAPYFNKRQGFSIGDGFIVCSFGGAFDSHVKPTRASVQGIRIYGFDGSLLGETMLRPDVMLGMMQEHLKPAYTQTRIENEGVFVDSKGVIYTQFFYASRAQSLDQRKREGVVLFKHKASRTSFDYAGACDVTPMRDIQEGMRYLSRFDGAKSLNPLTGAAFTSLADIMDMMRLCNIPEINYSSGAIQGLLDVDGTKIPNGLTVNIKNRTNVKYIVSVFGDNLNLLNNFTATYNPSSKTYSKEQLFLKFNGNVSGTARLCRLLAGTLGTDSGSSHSAALALDWQDSPGIDRQLLLIGGGSSLFASATEIRFMLNSNYSGAADYSGSWEIKSTSFNPRTDNKVSIGTASLRPSEIFSNSGVINTSDERLKQQFRSLDVREKAAALEIKKSICLFKFNEAVDLKGDGARWHCGVRAQEVIKVLESNGLDPMQYAFVCFDEWGESEEILESWEDQFDDDGNLTRKAGCAVVQEFRPAGSRYAIRYDELSMFILSAI